MQNILTLPLCQGRKNHKKINDLINHGTIELISYELSEENVTTYQRSGASIF